MLRGLVKSGLALGLSKTGATTLLGIARGSRNLPLIVGYHRVVEDFEHSSRSTIPAMLISARMLEKHLDWLGRRYKMVSLEDLGRRLDEGRSTAGLAAVTFDDGYRDVYENAFSILKRKGIPAGIFVVTDLVGTSRPLIHDRLYALLPRALSGSAVPADELARLHRDCGLSLPGPERLVQAGRTTFAAMRLLLSTLPYLDLLAVIAALEARFGVNGEGGGQPLTWDMIEEMRAAGMTIGSHTRTHVLLPHESPAKKGDELSGSRRILEERLAASIDHIAYPDGRFDARTVKATAEAGYRFGYTTCGHRDPRFPLLTLPRRVLWERSCVDTRGSFSGDVMACLMSGVFDVMSMCSPPHGPGIDARQELSPA